MRKKISESNEFPNFDLFVEYQKIESLLSEQKIIGTFNRFGNRLPPSYTIEEYIDQLYFNNWNLRGTFISISEMRHGLDITKDSLNVKPVVEEKMLDFLQYVINCLFRVENTIETCRVAYIADKTLLDVILSNIKKLIERLKCSIEFDEENCEIFIVYNNDIADVVAVDFPDIAASISEYKRIDNKGDLERKGEILCTLFKKLESIERRLLGTTYNALVKDTTFLFNKTGARHWIEKDKLASKTFLKMPPDELELWYDRTYNMFLSCMVISSYLDVKNQIDEIKKMEIQCK